MWHLLTDLGNYAFIMGYLYVAYIVYLGLTNRLTARANHGERD